MTYRTLNNYTVNGFVTFMLYCFRILVKLCCESRYTERVSLFFLFSLLPLQPAVAQKTCNARC